MAWLLRDGEVLASLEVADSRRARSRGLLGRSGVEGALLLRPCRSVHSLGMRFSMDVAFCDDDLQVLRVVIEAEAGAFARWGLRPGDVLEVKG